MFLDGEKKKVMHKTFKQEFFWVILRSPEETLEADEVELVFSLRVQDLYLLGFLQGNMWYLFSDARLDGSGYDQLEHFQEWTKPDSHGNHNDDRIQKVEIGVAGLADMIETLLNHNHRKLHEVKTALYHVIVAVSKPSA